MKTLIVGAGPGGLSAAINLAGLGADVTVVEKEAVPGGRMRGLTFGERGEYQVDTGPSIMQLPQVLERIFRRSGLRIEDYVKLVRLPENTRVHFWDGTHLDTRQRIGAFTEKDLQLLKALASQAAVSIANARLIRKVEEDAKTRGQLSRFLPSHVVEAMVEGKGQPIMKGGRECDASVLFCDIRGFTSMSESSGPQEIVGLLNEYFERLVEVVFEREGVLDKFIGDAMMAHWGTLVGEEDEDHALKAVIGALGLRDAIRELNRERSVQRLPPIGMGVGVNSGSLVAGYMGARRRLEYTVIGDTVNTASRLCGLAQPDQVVMSESTYHRVAAQIEARYLGTRQVKGKEQSVKIYEAVAIREDSESSRNTGS